VDALPLTAMMKVDKAALGRRVAEHEEQGAR
jgi:non-ribosomal peptide synthetase component E (peptide arylation enzyme)